MDAVVLPQRPQHQPRLILLDGQGAGAVRIDPWQPRAPRVAIRSVLVEEVALLHQCLLAELEELARHVLMAGSVERVGHQRAVTRPRIRIRVARELRDVEIRRGDHRPAIIDVGSRGQHASPVKVGDLMAKVFVDVAMVLLGPHLPVGPSSVAIRFRTFADDEFLAERRDLAQPRTHAKPVRHRPRLVRAGGAQVEADGAVD